MMTDLFGASFIYLKYLKLGEITDELFSNRNTYSAVEVS